jgi:hypothetical protein
MPLKAPKVSKINMLFRSIIVTVLYSSLILFYSCQSKPHIPISDNLKIALGNKYPDYVSMLNKATLGDTFNVRKFLEIDYIGEGGGYDHGWVLVQLMKKVGDEKFVNALQSFDKKKLDNVKQYFEVGIDNGGNKNAILFNEYPNTFKYLGFSKAELEMFKK